MDIEKLKEDNAWLKNYLVKEMDHITLKRIDIGFEQNRGQLYSFAYQSMLADFHL